jgi:hypothetical protein
MRILFPAFTSTLAVGCLFATAPVVAQTPDTHAPTRKSVCDVFKADEVTEGLHEFCVLFCERGDSTAADTLIADDRNALSSRDKGPSRLCLGFWAAVPAHYGPPRSWQIYEAE